jgi:hypothetical protein
VWFVDIASKKSPKNLASIATADTSINW